MYDKVPNNMNFVEREVQVEKYWKDNDIFGKSIKAREGAPVFTFYDGPPTANGKPHIGHIITRAVKDLIPRYKTMKGYKVLRKAGWDTHGLPVELEVEKTLGLDGKDQIEGYGVEPFIEKCKESVWTYEQEPPPGRSGWPARTPPREPPYNKYPWHHQRAGGGSVTVRGCSSYILPRISQMSSIFFSLMKFRLLSSVFLWHRLQAGQFCAILCVTFTCEERCIMRHAGT